MATYSYWRLSIYNSDGWSATAVAEWKFFDAGASQIATTGGTASASSTFSGQPASSAFDGSASTFWNSNSTASPTSPEWLQYQFPSAVTPATFSITARNDSFYYQAPGSFSLQGSNDGSTWTTVGNYSAAWASAGQTKTFTVGAYGLGDAYRLLITSTDGGGVTSVAEWVLKDGGGSALSLSNGYGEASSVLTSFGNVGPHRAFDGNSSTFWNSNNAPSGGSPQWLMYRFEGSVTVGSFSITARGDGSFSQTPHAFSLQKSVDGGTTWTTSQSYTAATWTNGQTQTFTVSSAATVQPLIFVIC